MYDRSNGVRRVGKKKEAACKTVMEVNRCFCYPALEKPHDVRLLSLDPGSIEEPLKGSLRVVSLNDPPAFEAVSYCWGAPQVADVLWCDGTPLSVTQSVSELLRQLRDTKTTRNLWIDAVCIDQDNADECQRQIGLMGDLYRKAHEVIVWLGPGDEQTDKAFTFAQETYEVCRRIRNDDITLRNLLANGFPAIDDPRWSDLWRLVMKTYWSRSWVVQEIALAHAPVIRCGSKCFPWSSFVELNDAVDRVLPRHLAGAASLIPILRIRDIKKMSMTMARLLVVCNSLGASKGEDKIFSVLNLASDGDKFRHLLEYRGDVVKVYIGATRIFMQQHDLTFLHYAGGMAVRRQQGLPSWVADWSTDGNRPGLEQYLGARVCVAHGNPESFPTMSHDERFLTLSAFVVSKVSKVGSLLPDFQRRSGWMFLQFQQWQMLASQAHPWLSESKRIEAFCLTIVCLHYWTQLADFTTATDAYLAMRGTNFKELDLTSPRNHELMRYREVALFACFKRTFFVAASGHIGLGPKFLRPGDVIVAFTHAVTLFAIRPTQGGRYELLGEVFVHGMVEVGMTDDVVQELVILE